MVSALQQDFKAVKKEKELSVKDIEEGVQVQEDRIGSTKLDFVVEVDFEVLYDRNLIFKGEGEATDVFV